jgi:hypothetical protein
MSTMMRPGQPADALIWPPCDGSVDTTEAKMSSDMPLPIPFCVTSSPSHMSMAVPVVRVRTMSSTCGRSKSGMRSKPVLFWAAPKPPPPLWNTKARPVDCMTAMAMVR